MPQHLATAAPQGALGLRTDLGLRPGADRGLTRNEWLDSSHAFSFGGSMDPRWMGCGSLRVLDEDRVSPGSGSTEQGRRNMEILTLVQAGAPGHRDSTGGGGVLRSGSAQPMSAGRGTGRSEFNASREEPARFLRIWLEPTQAGAAPRYQEREFGPGHCGAWRLVASPDGHSQSLSLGADALVHTAELQPGGHLSYTLDSGRRMGLQMASAVVSVGDRNLAEGDGLFSRALAGGGRDVVGLTAARLTLFGLG